MIEVFYPMSVKVFKKDEFVIEVFYPMSVKVFYGVWWLNYSYNFVVFFCTYIIL